MINTNTSEMQKALEVVKILKEKSKLIQINPNQITVNHDKEREKKKLIEGIKKKSRY